MQKYAPYPLTYKLAKRKWMNWQQYKIETDNDVYLPRSYVIKCFVENDLVPFLKRNGYQIACDMHRLAECIARVLYFGYVKHEPLNTEYLQEDYDHYYWSLSDEKWKYFWREWSWWQDLGDEHRNLHEEIRFCVWTMIDLDNSKQTRILNEILGISDDDDNSSNGSDRAAHAKDPYLKDYERGYYN
jgi:hypothetical protein